jgi:tRNA threonylcarbamoyladenosine modification (KEOPS) complex Cgi121 subunit
MILDIQDWGLEPYHTWGFFNVPSQAVRFNVKSIFSYCSKLDTQSITIVFISTKHLAGVNHAFLASYFSLKALIEKRNLAKDLGMELLLYLSQQNQIYTAMAESGISDQQKDAGEMWAVVFFSISTGCLVTEKEKLETYLEIPLLDVVEDTQQFPLGEYLAATHQFNAIYLGILEHMVRDIPRLPVIPASKQESAVLQAIIEKMVLLSIEKVKPES